MPPSLPGVVSPSLGRSAVRSGSAASVEQPELLDKITGYALAVNLLIASVAFVSLWDISATVHLTSWLGFILLGLMVRFVLHRGASGALDDPASARYWHGLVVASCGALGAGWGWLGLFLFPVSGAEHQALAIMVLAVAVATAPSLAPSSEAAAAFLLPAVAPTAARLALFGAAEWAAAAALLCLLMCFVWWAVLRQRAALTQSARLRREKEQSEVERNTYVRSVETANRLFAEVVLEREQAETEMRKAKLVAENASRAKGDFLAYTSHEIRTPLNAIIGLTRVLMDTPLSDQQRDYMRRVRNAGDRLLSLINDLLDMAKIEAGKIDIEHVDFGLREVLDEIIQEQLVRATEKALSLKLEVADEIPDGLVGDPLRLRQVLLNLVNNAIKFTAEGSVTVHVRLLERDGDSSCRLRFEVIDTGIGVPPEKQAILFERYAQAEISTSRKFGGTGLGLSISKSLVDLMSGAIGLHSEVHRGTEFFVELPFGLRAASAPAPATDSGVSQPTLDRALRVLVAEDNEDNQLLIELLLKKQGAAITIVGNGQEALAQLEREPYDLVLMDLEMPVMGGFDAIAVLREREKSTGKHVPVYALSAHALEGYREKCIAAGMDGYLTKPIDPEALYATMATFVGTKPESA